MISEVPWWNMTEENEYLRADFHVTSYGQAACRWLISVLDIHEKLLINDMVGKANPEQLSVRGTVHRFGVWDVPELMRANPDAVVMNLIRHPVTRLNSRANAFHVELSRGSQLITDFVDGQVLRNRKLVEKWFDRLGLNSEDLKTRAFVAAALSYSNMVDEIVHARDQLGYGPEFHIVMERLVSDRSYFTFIFRQLTGRQIQVDTDYLDRVFSSSPDTNARLSHSGRVGNRCPVEVVESWEPWQKQIVEDVFDRFGSPGLFDGFGYDLTIS